MREHNPAGPKHHPCAPAMYMEQKNSLGYWVIISPIFYVQECAPSQSRSRGVESCYGFPVLRELGNRNKNDWRPPQPTKPTRGSTPTSKQHVARLDNLHCATGITHSGFAPPGLASSPVHQHVVLLQRHHFSFTVRFPRVIALVILHVKESAGQRIR